MTSRMKPLKAKSMSAPLRLFAAVLVAACFLAVCSKNSPLYPMNDWMDANCFFTMGREVVRGRVMYLDMYEQKGPIVYFVYALAALIDPNSFIGAFLVETLCFALYLYYGSLIVELYVDKRNGSSRAYRVGIMSVLAFSVCTALSFSHGGSVEEMSLFMFAFSLHRVLSAVRRRGAVRAGSVLLIGLFGGLALFSKFTLFGFYIGLAVFICIYYFRETERGKRLARIGAAALLFLLGAAAVCVPVLAYFMKKGAVSSFVEAYFVNNIVAYPSMGGGTLQRILSIVKNIAVGFALSLPENGFVSLMLIAGAYCVYKKRRVKSYQTLAVLLSFFALGILTFAGGITYAVYYPLALAAFAPIGLALAFAAVKERRSAEGMTPFSRKTRCFGASLLAGSLLLASLILSFNTYLLLYEKSKLPQYVFAQRIKQREGASLLNYGFLDGGFYFASGASPASRFFCRLNIPLDEMAKEQDACVRDGRASFVVTRDEPLEGDLGKKYRLVDTAKYYHEWEMHTFYLYELAQEQ